MQRLLRTPGAWPYLIAIFLNAFMDLGHKIVIQNTVFKSYDGTVQIVLTALVNGLILLPFIMLFSPAGHVADTYPKVRILRFSAWQRWPFHWILPPLTTKAGSGSPSP